MLKKILQMSKDAALTKLIATLLFNQQFQVDLISKKSRWYHQRNGLPQGSVLAPLLNNIYTNDQPIDQFTKQFIYADNLCITSQAKTLKKTSQSLEELTQYYTNNHLKANASKMLVCSFHLKKRRSCQVP